MKAQEIFGILFGIIFFIVWVFILNSLSFTFFSEKYVISGNEITKIKDIGQIFNWLIAGILPLFIILGHYLIYANPIGGIEKTYDIKMMKIALLGFSIWLLITIITFLFKINIPHSINIGGGYLTMLIVYFLMNKIIIHIF